MISKKPTKRTPFLVQHGRIVRDVNVPNDDIGMCECAVGPSECHIDGYASTIEEAKKLAEARYSRFWRDEDMYDIWFDVSEGSGWSEDIGDFADYASSETIDFWMEGLLRKQAENREAIAKVIMKVIDLGGSAGASFVLLKALRECMANSAVGMMANRDEIVSYVYDKDNWYGAEDYDPEYATRILDAARKKALGASAKDFFEEE